MINPFCFFFFYLYLMFFFFFFFFFKQKTAYEMELRLEFRRVHFRSEREHVVVLPHAVDLEVAQGASLAAEADLLRDAQRGRVARYDRGLHPVQPDVLEGRSEERRVGKECRSRWSPYQEKKKVVERWT